jgi:hypothetical protein
MDPSQATTFEIEAQSGQNISNIGGDQTIYFGDRSQATRIGRVLAMLGLLLSVLGIAVLMPAGITTAHSVWHDTHHVGGLQTPYTRYLSWVWALAAGLLVAGLVIKRVARILVGR